MHGVITRWFAVLVALAALGSGCGDDGSSADTGTVDTGVSDTGSPDASDASPDTLSPDAGAAARSLCNCLLITCHDDFHAEYGPTDEVAIPACEMDATSLASAGMAVTTGDFIECRAAFCEMAATDETMCAAALGGAPCQ